MLGGEIRQIVPARGDLQHAPIQSPITQGLAKFFNSKTFSDVTLVTLDGNKLHCHRLVLAACSDRLDRLLGQDPSSTTVEIPCMDVEPEALDNLVQFCYSSTCNFTLENAIPTLCAAQKYGVCPLETLASAYALAHLTVQTCCALSIQASNHGCERLKIQCLALAAERLDEVSQTEGFLSLSIDELKRLLKNPELLSCSEVTLFKAMCSWVLRDIRRIKHMEQIQATMNFPEMSEEQSERVRELLKARHEDALQASPSPRHQPDEGNQKAEPQGMEIETTALSMPGASGEEQMIQVEAYPIPLMQSVPQGSVTACVPGGMSITNGDVKPSVAVSTSVSGNGTAGGCVGAGNQGINAQLQELFVAQLVQGNTGTAPVAMTNSQAAGSSAKRDAQEGGPVGSPKSENKRMDCSDVASGTDETDQNQRERRKQETNGATPPAPKQARSLSLTSSRASRSVCQVEGCGNTLEGLRDYHVRYKICDHHLKISSIIKAGRQQRFCQQCGRFHDLSEFDGNKRSCRSRLMRHNARRRKRLKTETEEKVSVPSPTQSLICVLPSGQTGTAKLLPHTSVTFSQIPANGQEWREHLPVQFSQFGYPISQLGAGVSTSGGESLTAGQQSALIQCMQENVVAPGTSTSPVSWFPAFGVVTANEDKPAEGGSQPQDVDLKMLSTSQVVTGQAAPTAITP
ncbi:hypothetical protein BSKO_09484 [Bryopsis sp. KO-2023]|nr:hypothetical protein BSKO_09484 [Bryopsis sp. KO-2023]